MFKCELQFYLWKLILNFFTRQHSRADKFLRSFISSIASAP